jgi:hypothetical protein
MTGRAAYVRVRRHENAADDLVRILSKLTIDVERFDSVVLRQRKMIEHLAGHLGDLDHDLLRRHSERFRLEAAEMVACARQALEELNRLAEVTSFPVLPPSHRGRPGRVPTGRRAD